MPNPSTLYLGLAAAGAGGYYLYRAGGGHRTVREEMRDDMHRAHNIFPRGPQAVRAGEDAGKEGIANIDEAVNNARTEGKPDERIPEATQNGISRIDQIRHDTARKMGTTVDNLDRRVEQKASEAKGTLAGWFGTK